ncbi:FMRFamide receptor-like [Brachionus plicatilis]|uniref:FMRFamide receptor-like n=1 Tax=Brachionus plicatilis TaxID=10195 RepID=A0A3M7T4I3_BRAPC|nr:FMRFamide receptor-like [Brachionus plicatilis]
MKTTSFLYSESKKNFHLETNFLQYYDHWFSEINSFRTTPQFFATNVSQASLDLEMLTKTILSATTSEALFSSTDTTSFILPNGQNCSNIEMYFEAKKNYKPVIYVLNLINYIIIIIGILFNTINLIVLLKSKLNESPYSYLTMLSLSDLGALAMVGAEKFRQLFHNSSIVHIYFVMMINIFLSCSMYVTLALTIERFIFVHSPFRAMTICRKSIARKVCGLIFLFSVLRSSYLPMMYTQNCWSGFSQKKHNLLDLYEFLISLAVPYTLIFIANISLIISLKKQNNLMSIPVSSSACSISARNGEINLPKSSLNRTDSDEDEAVGESKKKLSCKSALSFRMENKSSKLIPHSNTSNSICTNSSYHTATRLSRGSKSSKTMSLYHRSSNIREMRNQKKLTITLVIILCLLLVCYLPSFLFEESLADFIFGAHDSATQEAIRPFIIKAIGNRVAIILIYFNCMANFLIYCFCNKKFKNCLKILIKKSILFKVYSRTRFYMGKFCCGVNKSSYSGLMVGTDQDMSNVYINNPACSARSANNFKSYQQKKYKNSLKEHFNRTKYVPVRKSKSMIVK